MTIGVDPAPSYSCYWSLYERHDGKNLQLILIRDWHLSTEGFGQNVGGDELNWKRNLWLEIPECYSEYYEEFEILENSVITAFIRRFSNWCDIQLWLYQNNDIVNILTGYCRSHEYLIDVQLSLWWYDLVNFYILWCRLIYFSKIFGSIEWELESQITEHHILTCVKWIFIDTEWYTWL